MNPNVRKNVFIKTLKGLIINGRFAELPINPLNRGGRETVIKYVDGKMNDELARIKTLDKIQLDRPFVIVE